jgi:hypothetical protein
LWEESPKNAIITSTPWTDVVILKIFSKKKLAKNGVFDSKQSLITQMFDHIIGF